MVAARIANPPDHRPRSSGKSANLPAFEVPAPVSQADAAKMLNVSGRTVRAARAVQDDAGPEIAARVTAGEVPVSVAADIATAASDVWWQGWLALRARRREFGHFADTT